MTRVTFLKSEDLTSGCCAIAARTHPRAAEKPSPARVSLDNPRFERYIRDFQPNQRDTR
jgi:hypothetical protein